MSILKAAWRSTLWGNIATLAMLVALAAALSTLQGGDWWMATPRTPRWVGAALALLTYLGFCGALLWRTRERRPVEASASSTSQPAILVAYASQTGFAQQVAERSAENLRSAGAHVSLRNLSEVDQALLATTERALFVVSTTGEGDPPDPALGFVRDVMTSPTSLGQLHYAVLALGDREYEEFCGFGHRLDNWFRQHGAQPLFDITEVDNADESALRHWQHHLGRMSGVTDLPDWSAPHYEDWILATRDEVNPGSLGGAAFRISLAAPAQSEPHWVAGDIAEIGPWNSPKAVASLLTDAGIPLDSRIVVAQEARSLAELLACSHLPRLDEIQGRQSQAIADGLKPLPHREYSIASLPSEGSVQLLVRRMLRADGTPGLGSGWLCDYAGLGDTIALRLRSNPNFHAPAPQRPMILVGNGTGIAGLRAHLRQRIAAGAKRNWLLFGERSAAVDFFYEDEMRQWQAEGWIEHLDLAFSRDEGERVYVQHRLQEQAGLLRAWLEAGACLYVCGSLDGMAPGVDGVLRQAIGDTATETLLAEGRYRRDVY